MISGLRKPHEDDKDCIYVYTYTLHDGAHAMLRNVLSK